MANASIAVVRRRVRRARVAALALIDPLYRRLKHSAAARVLETAPLRWLRYRLVPGMGVTEVLEVLGALNRAGVPCWLVGGWGVDALIGHQTRKHPDVDLAVERSNMHDALTALEGAGFAVVQRETLPAWMSTMIQLRDGRRRWIELMVVEVPAPAAGQDGRPTAMRFSYGQDSFTMGTLDGHAVPCLAAAVQVLFHTGYPPRDSDRHDVRLLTERFGLPVPAAYA